MTYEYSDEQNNQDYQEEISADEITENDTVLVRVRGFYGEDILFDRFEVNIDITTGVVYIDVDW